MSDQVFGDETGARLLSEMNDATEEERKSERPRFIWPTSSILLTQRPLILPTANVISTRPSTYKCLPSSLRCSNKYPPFTFTPHQPREMIVVPSLNLTDLKRVLSTRSRPNLSPRAKALTQSFKADDEPQTYTLPWNVLPKGAYTPDEEPDASYAYAADLVAELPITSTAMYLLSEGVNIGNGAINIYEDSDDKLAGSELLVDVRIYYNSSKVHNVTSVSFVHEAQNVNGIRFHTAPSTPSQVLNRFISINVRIPRATGSDQLSLPAFRTHLPNFVHSLGDLASTAHFSSISLSTSDQDITVKSLSAQRTRLRTSNGAISGAFTSDSSISLRTANGPITANIALSNDGASPSNVELLTTYDEVNADLTLTSTAPFGAPPVFHVHAKSSQKPLSISCVPSAPLPDGAVTQFEISTTNARAQLRAPEGYVGAFELHSTPYKPVVIVPQVEVGEGQGREVVFRRERRGLVEGRLVRGGAGDSVVQERKESRVVMKTSNAEAQLVL
ncbi:hypothetical protein BC835DRAFT_1375274 [Cytidiella melzeri]|nr:hypothetical protein BC835DRAFT_1375274 [Cytidiella melzeri]